MRMYLDEDVKREEAYIMFERGLKKIGRITKKYGLISIVTNYYSFRYFSLRNLIFKNVDKIMRIENIRNKSIRIHAGDKTFYYYPLPMYQMILDDYNSRS